MAFGRRVDRPGDEDEDSIDILLLLLYPDGRKKTTYRLGTSTGYKPTYEVAH
jgi:hypothetical protein